MTCCKCEEFGWNPPQHPEEGQDYCVFHAPAERKIYENRLLSVGKFNELVFKHIDEMQRTGTFCNLSGTIFPGNISFKDYNERNPLPSISFNGTTFNGETNFAGAKFRKNAWFERATFDGLARFNWATFDKGASFQNAKFGGNALFEEAVFGKPDGSARFLGATFDGYAFFWKTTFNGYAWFEQAKFNKGGEFRNITAKKAMKFRECLVEKPIRFIDMYLKRCDFLRTDMTNIHFVGSRWPEKGGRYRIAQEDEKVAQEDEEGLLLDVKNFYQAMKRKYKQEHDEAEVSRWHLAEKEVQLELMKRNRESWFLRFALSIYRHISGYGEDPLRALYYLSFLAIPLPLFVLTDLKLLETGNVFSSILLFFALLLLVCSHLAPSAPWWINNRLLLFICRHIKGGYDENPLRSFTWLGIFTAAPLSALAALKILEVLGYAPAVGCWDLGQIFQDWLRCFPLTKVPHTEGAIPTTLVARLVAMLKPWILYFFQVLIMLQATLLAFALRNKFRR